MPEHPLHDLAMSARYDLTAAQGKLTELMRQLAALDLPTPTEVRCPKCGVATQGPRTLAEHLHVSHDGPVPEHWLAVEAVSVEPWTPFEDGARAHTHSPVLSPGSSSETAEVEA